MTWQPYRCSGRNYAASRYYIVARGFEIAPPWRNGDRREFSNVVLAQEWADRLNTAAPAPVTIHPGQGRLDVDITVTCPECGAEHSDEEWEDVRRADGRMCSECYVNDECPDQCNDEHDPPDTTHDAESWECPETGVSDRWCEQCYEWLHDRYGDGSTNVGTRRYPEWVCEPGEHDYTTCEDCGVWLHYDDTRYDEYNERYLCSSCWDEGDYHDGAGDGSFTPTCERCHSRTPTHYHPVTEEVACTPCATAPDDPSQVYEPIPVLAAA
jgi:hypothetical protein